MWLDDAVETFKCHVEYEESATQTRHPCYCNGECTIPELTWWDVYLMDAV